MAEGSSEDEIQAQAAPRIGTLQESSLHAALKTWYAQPGDQLETVVAGYVIDILRGDLLVEIQTRNFSAIKAKLVRLVEAHPVRLVYPLVVEKWIIKNRGNPPTLLGRRKSPRRGRLETIFVELVRLPQLINHPNFTIEVLLIQAEEVWQDDGRGSWRRRGWSIVDRRLLGVSDCRLFSSAADFADLLPAGLPEPFTTRQLAKALKLPIYLAGKMLYCLHAMGAVGRTGRRGRSFLYALRRE
jgi:hypothetical protein